MEPKIEHLIVLMMENRSFDHMLGFLDHSPEFDRLSEGDFPNRYSNSDPAVGVTPAADHETPSPGHDHLDIMQQMFGEGDYAPDWRPPTPSPGQDWPMATQRGYVRNLGLKHGQQDSHRIMQCFAHDSIPVLHQLARDFVVCDRWFSAVPGATWPNRDYVISGTSRGEVDIEFPDGFHPVARTIFDAVKKAGRSWKVYHQDMPHTVVYDPLRVTFSRRFRSHRRLLRDIQNHTSRKRRLPNFSWVEPDYGIKGRGNSQHPGQAGSASEFYAGERLISDIYNALLERHRDSDSPEESLFAKALFVVTYDEHGGFFDHVPPPAATPPDHDYYRKGGYEFRFDLLGPRVPAVVINPWLIARKIDSTILDHSAIPATVRSLFDTRSLQARDASSNFFWRPEDPAWAAEHLSASVRTDLQPTRPIEHDAVAPSSAGPPTELNDLQKQHVHLEGLLAGTLGQEDLVALDAGGPAVDVFERVRRSSPRNVDITTADGLTWIYVSEDPDPEPIDFDACWELGPIQLVDDEDRSLSLDRTLRLAEYSTEDTSPLTGTIDDAASARALFLAFLDGDFVSIDGALGTP